MDTSLDKCLRMEKDFVLCKIVFYVISAFHYQVLDMSKCVILIFLVLQCILGPAIPIDAAIYLAPERIDSSQIQAN